MQKEKPAAVPWEETRAQWQARAQRCAKSINAECDVPGLCHEFPARLRGCAARLGDRLRKWRVRTPPATEVLQPVSFRAACLQLLP